MTTVYQFTQLFFEKEKKANVKSITRKSLMECASSRYTIQRLTIQ